MGFLRNKAEILLSIVRPVQKNNAMVEHLAVFGIALVPFVTLIFSCIDFFSRNTNFIFSH